MDAETGWFQQTDDQIFVTGMLLSCLAYFAHVVPLLTSDIINVAEMLNAINLIIFLTFM